MITAIIKLKKKEGWEEGKNIIYKIIIQFNKNKNNKYQSKGYLDISDEHKITHKESEDKLSKRLSRKKIAGATVSAKACTSFSPFLFLSLLPSSLIPFLEWQACHSFAEGIDVLFSFIAIKF